MSLLSIISGTEFGAAVRCKLPPPAAIIGSNDPNAQLLLQLAQEEGRELLRRHDWQNLLVDYTFTSVAAETQNALPADFERFAGGAELWNRSLNQPYIGPVDLITWQRLKGLNYAAGTPGYWRYFNNQIQILPAPAAGQTLAIPYVSGQWVQAADSSKKSAFTADTDTALLPERLIALGIVWRFKQNRGLDYAEDLSSYERELVRTCAADRPQAAIVLAPRSRGIDFTWPGRVVP